LLIYLLQLYCQYQTKVSVALSYLTYFPSIPFQNYSSLKRTWNAYNTSCRRDSSLISKGELYLTFWWLLCGFLDFYFIHCNPM
jgi:hypothetical protein